ncbi:AraC family transcriptional regulator [Chitinophaga tropicalis]|uniref:Helix-turn-helix domain-containing protein n=1 Tax=Chitinophaga tropicalis TaxID=2683588 RepID=A0A7K1U0C5_9BACT|nr:AraC family transcriptional regulator [Chitinophaga tropicalis]MVT07824.1 helix-turn-helix domain-containing protein [Chitinophaga tropicalis]
MEETIIPYELPNTENHSFFFVDVRISPEIEAKLHQHDAWELYYVIRGYGSRIAGDTVQPFSEGDVVLIPPNMLHRWEFVPGSADDNGVIHYLMVAFSHSLLLRCMEQFPELRNRMTDIKFPVDALKFGTESSRNFRKMLVQMNGMDELDRLCEMFRLLPAIFGSSDYVSVGKPIRIERDVRRMLQISTYVMCHYAHTISLDDIAAEVGMNRSAFCTYFKRSKGMTFSQFVSQYRLNTACEMLKHSQKQVSEICYIVGFNDLPHFIRVFTKAMGMPPLKYRKQFQ